MTNIKANRDNIDAEIRKLTRNARVNDELRRELFGAVAVCPKVDENFGARNLFWQMSVIYDRYKGHKDELKHLGNQVRIAAQKLYLE